MTSQTRSSLWMNETKLQGEAEGQGRAGKGGASHAATARTPAGGVRAAPPEEQPATRASRTQSPVPESHGDAAYKSQKYDWFLT